MQTTKCIKFALSIITPVLNGERWIEDCINCVINQGRTDVEHIIIDGLSTDNTLSIIKEYSRKYDHLRFISEKDGGQSEAMNKGIHLANADIINFLNVDDAYEPDVYDQVIEIFRNLPPNSFLTGNCRQLGSDGKINFINRPKKLDLKNLLMGWKVNPHPMNPSAYFYHKTIHDMVGWYREDEHYLMDLDFIFRMVQKANCFYVDRHWGIFNYRENTKTYRSINNGSNEIETQKIIKRYMKTLNPLIRLYIFTVKKSILLKRHLLNSKSPA